MKSGVYCGEASGRIDLLGGVADYSGSLVLEIPTRAMTRVEFFPAPVAGFRLCGGVGEAVEVAWDEAARGVEEKREPEWFRALFERTGVPGWARYPLGCVALLGIRKGVRVEPGLEISIRSEVPISMGVSSSAALEVATLRALTRMTGVEWRGTELARLAQEVENRVVGAPCGLMDQLASAHGVRGAVLPIDCRPDFLHEPVPLPDGVLVAGWPSGIKHSVGDSPYAMARAASFMGRKILQETQGWSVEHTAEISPEQLAGADPLPERMTGRDFLERWGGTVDRLTRIEPDRVYPLRAATRFPIEENSRCAEVVGLLRSGEENDLVRIGELMARSHAGYSDMGLGSRETDRMVDLVRAAGPAQGLYGARISGGGSGGTVAVLLHERGLPVLQELAARHEERMEMPLPLIFS
jgi:L-arabinokinase